MEEVKGMRPEVKKVIGIFGAWILISLFLYIIAPVNSKWIAWIPIWFILLAIILSLIIFLIKGAGFFKKHIARINGKEIKACQFCPMNRITPNPVSKNQFIYKCSAKDIKTIYFPGKVPRWCPYAIK